MVEVPLYRHEVSLDFVRVELAIQYTFLDDWDVWLRVPYEVKTQRVEFLQVDRNVSFNQLQNQVRHTNTHHRSATYSGISDLMLLVAKSWRGLLAEDDSLVLAWGLTVPTGQTQRDPFVAGDLGKKHLHIQFGSGTVDPLLELSYSLPLPAKFNVGGFAAGRFPFYENNKGYRAPVDLTAGLRAGHSPLEWLSVGADFSFYWQSFASWNGTRDVNSGLVSFMAGAGVTLIPGGGFVINLGARLPIHTESLAEDGDTFEQGPSMLLSVAWTY